MPAPYSKHAGHRERGSRILLRNFKTSTEFLGPNRTGFFDRDEVVAAAAIGGRGLVILSRKLSGQLQSHLFISKSVRAVTRPDCGSILSTRICFRYQRFSIFCAEPT